MGATDNRKIAIITDSCADLSKEMQEQYDVRVLPMMIRCEDGEYRDGVDITIEDIYERLKTEIPKTDMNEEILKITALIMKSAGEGKLRKAVLSKPHDKTIQKAALRPITTAKGTLIQLETFTSDNKAYHKNISPDEGDALCEVLCGFSQINVFTTAGECQYSVSKKGKILMGGVDKVIRALDGASAVEYEKNNREKNRILVGNEPFLIRLGVSDENGRVYDKKQSKFRQINRFLEHIEEIYPRLPKEGELLIYDLCCGKSYLSFAVYYYLTAVKGRAVKMLGIDLKRDVILWCEGLARELGIEV